MPKFAKWCALEDRKYSVIQAVETSASTFPESVQAYVSTALHIPVNLSKLYWEDALEAFYKIHGVTAQINPIPLTTKESKSKNEKDTWDYSGRLWPMYLSILASAFGWSEKHIASLDVNMALAYLQEVLTEKQLEKEFQWQMSEVAYVPNKTTKKSEFRPLSRPYWMVQDESTRKAVPVPKSLLPVGNIIRIKTNETKATGLGGNVEVVSAPETGS